MYILFLFAALIAFMALRLLKTRKKAGIKGWVDSQDLDGGGSRVYRDHRTGISAKPDVVEKRRVIEHKSASVEHGPRRGDLWQVIGEMIAANREEGELVYGNGRRYRLHKNNSETKSLIKKVLRIKEQMIGHLIKGVPPKATPTKNKCKKCNVRNICSEAM